MVVQVPTLKLNNGLEMPTFGLGTYAVRLIVTMCLCSCAIMFGFWQMIGK